MSDITLTFSEKEFRTLKYLLSGVANSHKLLEQMNPEFKKHFELIKSGIEISADDITDIQDAILFLSYLDQNKYVKNSNGHYNSRKVFLKSLLKSNVNIFAELIEFVFLPIKKRDGYSFDSETREELADAAVEEGLYLPTVINHYFKLLAKGGSGNQKNRITRYLKMKEVKSNKNLILILSKSKHRGVQLAAIENADKSLYGFMIDDIKDEVAIWYLEKKMSNPSWSPHGKNTNMYSYKHSIENSYKRETGNNPKRSYK